jgi:hypothetical protein
VDSSSPAAAEHSIEVGGALVPRAAEISADIYQLIVREIPQVLGDTRVLKLLEASVGDNVATVLHMIQHGIDLENVRAPAAAQEYARRLAQRGVPVAALLRAYRIGSTRFQEWCLEELARRTDDASLVSAAGMRIAGILAAYIDKVSEEMLFAYESEKDSWLRNWSVARAARVRALLSGDRADLDSAEAILGYGSGSTTSVRWPGSPGRQQTAKHSHGWTRRPRRWRFRHSAAGGRSSSRRMNLAHGYGSRSAPAAASRYKPRQPESRPAAPGSGSPPVPQPPEWQVSAAPTSRR